MWVKNLKTTGFFHVDGFLHLILLFLFSWDDQYGRCFSILCLRKCGILCTRFLTFILWRKTGMLKFSFLSMETPTRKCVLVSNWFLQDYESVSLVSYAVWLLCVRGLLKVNGSHPLLTKCGLTAPRFQKLTAVCYVKHNESCNKIFPERPCFLDSFSQIFRLNGFGVTPTSEKLQKRQKVNCGHTLEAVF